MEENSFRDFDLVAFLEKLLVVSKNEPQLPIPIVVSKQMYDTWISLLEEFEREKE